MADSREAEWFPSKVDWWLAALIVAAPLIAAGVCLSALLAGDPAAATVALLAGVLPVSLILGALVSVRYGITATSLVIRFGLCRQTVALSQIVEVRPSRIPLSAPAPSLDRLQVRYGPGWLSFALISPADRDTFLSLLCRRAGLVRLGEGLSRRLP
jgi:hypothetical protein